MSINAVCLLPIIIRFSGSKGTTNSSFSNKGGWSQSGKGCYCRNNVAIFTTVSRIGREVYINKA